MPCRPSLAVVVVAALLTVLAGCGGGAERPVKASLTPSGSARGFLDGHTLEVHLGNQFRDGLYRLAVMSQRGERAPDVGQQLPTGKLSQVRCAPSSARPAAGKPWPWRCFVRWRAVGGHRRETRYAVRLLPRACFDAAADPAYAPIFDATINADSEHPLNALGRAVGRC